MRFLPSVKNRTYPIFQAIQRGVTLFRDRWRRIDSVQDSHQDTPDALTVCSHQHDDISYREPRDDDDDDDDEEEEDEEEDDRRSTSRRPQRRRRELVASSPPAR